MVSKIFSWGDILSVLWSEILFYSYVPVPPLNKISNLKTDNIPPQMKTFITVIPILMHFISFKTLEECLFLSFVLFKKNL